MKGLQRVGKIELLAVPVHQNVEMVARISLRDLNLIIFEFTKLGVGNSPFLTDT